MLTNQAAVGAGIGDIGDWMDDRWAYLRNSAVGTRFAGRRRPSRPPDQRASAPTQSGPPGSDDTRLVGRLRYEPQSREQQASFRREQTAFDRERRAEQDRDWWFSIPALAPVAAVLAAESPLLIGALIRSGARPLPPPVAPVRPLRPSEPLTDAEKAVIREAARRRAARALGVRPSDLSAQVHHRISLHFQHLMSRADPNRLANLQLLEQRAHSIASNEWMAFTRGLNGRAPTQAELVAQAMKVDRMIEPYLLRPGVPRPALPPRPPRLN